MVIDVWVTYRTQQLQERNAKDVEIPNIRWDVFELMMRLVLLFPF